LAACACLVALATACVEMEPPADLSADARRATGMELQPVGGVKVGFFTIKLAILGARMVMDEPVPIKGLRGVEVGRYRASLHEDSEPSPMHLKGWTPLVWMRDGSGERGLFLKQRRKDVSGVLVLVRQGDEVMAARLKGNLDLFLRTALSGMLPREGWGGVLEAMDGEDLSSGSS
jgi:hypothetical protein